MNHRLHIIRSALVFLFLVGALFAALALLPVMAQPPRAIAFGETRVAGGTGYLPQKGGTEYLTPGKPQQAQAAPVISNLSDVSILDASSTGYVIDDLMVSPYFRKTNAGAPPPPDGWSGSPGGNDNHVFWTSADDDGDYAEWNPDIPTGWYEVSVYYYAWATNCTDAKYEITRYGGTSIVTVDQTQTNSGLPLPTNSGWRVIGTFRNPSKVVLRDKTTAGPCDVVADAIRFAPLDVLVSNDFCPACLNDGRVWGVTAFDTIQKGLLAVGTKGTVTVKPGSASYNGPITITTSSITLTAKAGEASPVITITLASGADTAVQVLADDVTVKGFTVQSNGAPRGIANYRVSVPAWEPDVHAYRILNNTVRGFVEGMTFYQASGEVSNNTVYSNTAKGIWIRDFPQPPYAPGSTTVARNVLYANGTGGGTDLDIEVQDCYTGTTVISNTITGSGAAGESCLYVLDRAGDLMLQENTLNGCWDGVRTEIAGGPFDVQLIRFSRNLITAGRTGISVTYTGGGAVRPIVQIGGSLTDSNRIFGNSEYQVWLENYGGTTITATHNYWGVCNLRGIEDEIQHQFDSPGLSLVKYEPALCVPRYITVEVRPNVLPADGFSTAVVTATATDIAHTPVVTGSMIGISTTFGSVPYGFAEAEGGLVTMPTVPWAPGADPHASGSWYVSTNNPAAVMRWIFKGTAVSMMYVRSNPGGLADVYVDGSLIKTINMQLPVVGPIQWQIEEVIANNLSATGYHTIEVQLNPASPPGSFLWLDAFRSGGTVLKNGRITTTLTSALGAYTDTVTAAIYNGTLIDSAMPPPGPFTAVITDTAEVVYLGADVWISKSVTPLLTSPGKIVTYTIMYSNTNVITATGTIITDTLPGDFVYVSSKSTPNLGVPIQAHPVYTWTVGNLKPGGKGWITMTARVNEAVPWPSTEVITTNVVQISKKVADTYGSTNIAYADITVRPNAAANITVTAYPTAVLADNISTAVITAEVTDKYHHPVLDTTVVTFTTTLTDTRFQTTGEKTGYAVTTGGVATIVFEAGSIAGTTWITATVDGVRKGIRLELYAVEPGQVFMSANPTSIPVSNGEISTTLRITVTDLYGNLVRSVPVTLTTDAGVLGANGITGSELIVTTTNGIATAKLGSGPIVTTATVTAAITHPLSIPAEVLVPFVAGESITVTSEFTPPTVRVCGGPEGMAYFTVTVKDEFGNLAQDGTPVMFSVSHGTRGEVRPPITGTVSGMAYATLISKGYRFPTGQREATMEVYISAGRAGHQINTSQLITLTPGLVDRVEFAVSPSPVKVQQQTHIEARVLDCAGNGVDDGTAVAFGATELLGTLNPLNTTTNLGLALTTFQANCTALPATVTATVDSKVFTTSIPIDPGVADAIFVDVSPSTILNCGGRAVVTATIRDACTNLVKDDTRVDVAPQFGYVTASAYYVYTRQGIVTVTVTSGNQMIPPADWPAGFESIAFKSGTAVPGWAILTIRPGPARRIVVSATPGEIPINGDVNGYDIAVSAIVADCSNTPVVDTTPVRLETSKGVFRESGEWYVDRWTAGGLVEATLTSQSVAGNVIITATANSNVGNAEAYFIPGEPWYVDVWSAPREWMYADGRSQLEIWARVMDEYHNPVVEGTTLAFITDFGHFLGSGDTYTTTTMTDGLAMTTLVADIEPHTALVRAITLNYRHGYTFVHMLLAPELKYIYIPNVTNRIYRP